MKALTRHFQTADELCAYVAQINDTVILSFSGGKDAIGAWLQLRRYFKRIIPFYMYLIPNLSFVNNALKYYEDFFQTPILQYPHPSLYRMLNNLVFQAPENCHIIEDMQLKEHSYDDISLWVKQDCGLSLDTFTATGVRAADSMTRRCSILKWGALNPRRRTFFPIFDWKKPRLIEELKAANVKLSIEYILFGRTFDGIDYRFIHPLKKNFSEDYQKILEYFPLAELEILRRQWRHKWKKTT